MPTREEHSFSAPPSACASWSSSSTSTSALPMVLSDLSLEEYVRSRTDAEEKSSRRSATGIPLRRSSSSASSPSSSSSSSTGGASSDSASQAASSTATKKRRRRRDSSRPAGAAAAAPPDRRNAGEEEQAVGGERRQQRKKAVSAKVANNLGATAAGIGARKQQGAVALYRPYASAIEALRSYHAVHGDLVIPRRFVVPSSSEYPEEWHGIDLASSVYDMRWWKLNVRSNADRVSELNTLGFVWERLQPEWNLVLEALVTYSMLHGHVRVPSSFVVPHDGDEEEAFPRATWGIRLGNAVHRMRIRHDFVRGPTAASRKAQLDGLGFVWDVNERAFLRTYHALKHFRRAERRKLVTASGSSEAYRFKALRVPSTFVVPAGEEHGWPEDLWGLPLGAKCSAIRHKGLYVKNQPDRQRALEELGFQWNGNATLGWFQVVHAAAVFSRLHGRVLDVPANFVVPAPAFAAREDVGVGGGAHHHDAMTDDAWPWPEQLWGFPLGQRLKDVRLKGAYLTGDSAAARRAQLDALGFNWTPKRGRRPRG